MKIKIKCRIDDTALVCVSVMRAGTPPNLRQTVSSLAQVYRRKDAYSGHEPQSSAELSTSLSEDGLR